MVRVVQYCFMAGLVSTAVITINKDAADAIRAVWGIFTPILTLVIGYYLATRIDKANWSRNRARSGIEGGPRKRRVSITGQTYTSKASDKCQW